jgi:thioredoxin 1
MTPLHTDDQTFQDVISSETPTLVDFWAEWCGPCKLMDRPLAEIAEEYAGKIVIAKLNVDDNPSTAMQYEVMSIPSMILFKDGQVQSRIVGARSKAQLLSDLRSSSLGDFLG